MRRLKVKRKYNQTAWLNTSAGKRWRAWREEKHSDEMGWDIYTDKLMATPALAHLSALIKGE